MAEDINSPATEPHRDETSLTRRGRGRSTAVPRTLGRKRRTVATAQGAERAGREDPPTPPARPAAAQPRDPHDGRRPRRHRRAPRLRRLAPRGGCRHAAAGRRRRRAVARRGLRLVGRRAQPRKLLGDHARRDPEEEGRRGRRRRCPGRSRSRRRSRARHLERLLLGSAQHQPWSRPAAARSAGRSSTSPSGRGLWDSGYHQGVDLLSSCGEPLYAAAAGVVSVSQESYGGYGVAVSIDHAIGGQSVNTLYGHMTYGSRQVSAGSVRLGRPAHRFRRLAPEAPPRATCTSRSTSTAASSTRGPGCRPTPAEPRSTSTQDGCRGIRSPTRLRAVHPVVRPVCAERALA